MTSPPREVTVCCPRCANQYQTWYRPSLNFDIETFDDEYIDAVTSAVCPTCGHKVYFDTLIVRDDVFYVGGE